MEFLPPDVVPLHNPAVSACDLDVCLDQRRSAEDVCAAALGNIAASSPITKLWKDIEQAINDPQHYDLPNIRGRAAEITDRGKSNTASWFQARVLAATRPLFVAAIERSTPRSVALQRSYSKIGRLAQETLQHFEASKSDNMKRNLSGRLAELAVHGVLLRAQKNIPFLGSQREESGYRAELNHDIAAFSLDDMRANKLPIQVGASLKPHTFRRSRILPLGVNEFLRARRYPLPKKTGYVALARLIAQDSVQPLGKNSDHNRLLVACGDSLNDLIDASREQFRHEQVSKSVIAFVDQTAPYRAPDNSKRATGRVRISLYTQNEGGDHIFADSVSATRGQDDRGRQTSQISFSYRGKDVSKITVIDFDGGAIINEQALGRSKDTPQRLLRCVGAQDVVIDWSSARSY